jgi:parallel beta-helix repeat protein
MNDYPAVNSTTGSVLRRIAEQYLPPLDQDAVQAADRLQDLAGAHRWDAYVLVGAAQQGVLPELLASAGSGQAAALGRRLARQLQDNLGLSAAAARWAVLTWAQALGLTGYGMPRRAAGTRPGNAAGPAVLVVAARGAAHHETIAAAISAAQPETQILVRPGIYREALVIDKAVELIADGPAGSVTIVSAVGPCVLLTADQAMIRGFTLRGRAGAASGEAYCVDIGRGNPLLESCDISSDSLSCVYVHGTGTAATIRDCRIHDGTQAGILISGSAEGTVEDCDIWGNNMDGVHVSRAAGPVIRRCTVRQGHGAGIWAEGPVTVQDCDIWGNERSGVVISGGSATITDCRIHDGLRAGVIAQFEGCGILQDCDVYRNNMHGVEICERGRLEVRRCTIRDSGEHGINAETGGNGIIENCELTGNTGPAISIALGSGNVAVSGCHVEESEAARQSLQTAGATTQRQPAEIAGRVARLRDDAERAARSASPVRSGLVARAVWSSGGHWWGYRGSDGWSDQAAALRKVAIALLGTDPDRAETIARSMDEASEQGFLLGRLAFALRQTDPDRAERIARSITDSKAQAVALGDLAAALAGTDPDRAEELARLTSDESDKAYSLTRIADAVASTDPERAERIARSVTRGIWRARAMASTAEAIAETDPERAERIAKSVTDPKTKRTALIEVAKKVAGTDPTRAVRLLRESEHLARSPASADAEALIDIISVLIGIDLDRAVRIAVSLQAPEPSA